mgnify:FL=1
MTPTEILDELTRRQPASEVRVTIPEGRNLLEVAQILEDAGLGDADAYVTLMRDPVFVDKLELEGPSL